MKRITVSGQEISKTDVEERDSHCKDQTTTDQVNLKQHGLVENTVVVNPCNEALQEIDTEEMTNICQEVSKTDEEEITESDDVDVLNVAKWNDGFEPEISKNGGEGDNQDQAYPVQIDDGDGSREEQTSQNQQLNDLNEDREEIMANNDVVDVLNLA